MVELKSNSLVFSFPETHPNAVLSIEFQRTLRIPDDGRRHRLPPGLGRFPVRHVDDGPAVPDTWLRRGGVMLPMYQAEALWIRFHGAFDAERQVPYPFAVLVAAGKINAVTGQPWTPGLHRAPQNYLVVPSQPWLDGFCVETGVIRQFVAMPLGEGYTAEEQVTGAAEYGGLQLAVLPMRREAFERRFPPRPREWVVDGWAMCCRSVGSSARGPAMGLAPGGLMTQDITSDPYAWSDWEHERSSRCFVHVCNSRMWRQYAGEAPPMRPPTAADYTKAGLPWFEYYGEGPAVSGSGTLAGLLSVLQSGKRKGESPLPENESVEHEVVRRVRPARSGDQVRESTI